MQTGSIVDFYDDPQGIVLKEKVAAAQIPDYIKTAQYLSDDLRNRIPDDVFALVMVDQGHKLRKYACVDRGNTALSVIYFMENHHKLPEEAQKVAAANLLGACEVWDLQPPEPLVKLAGARWRAFKRGWRGASESSKKLREMGVQPRFQNPITVLRDAKEVAKIDSTKNRLGLRRTNPSPERSKLREKLHFAESLGQAARFAAPQAAKATAVGGALVGAHQLGKHQGRKEKRKTASVDLYVDVTGQGPPVQFQQETHQRYCLVKEGSARFPIDSYGQVQQAVDWFDKYAESLHPEDRRQYCVKLAQRAEDLNIAINDKIKKYGGKGYAKDGEVKVAVCTRMQHWAEDSPERDMLKGLMDKYASVHPDVFCEALRQFDEATGMHYLWDDEIYDPWYSTYGFQKTAEYRFNHAGDQVTEEQLKETSQRSFHRLSEKFGEDMALEFRKNPVTIFDSLPLDSKRIIMRIANDPQPGK